MKAEQAYTKLQLKVNESYGNSKMSVDKGRAVLIINESMNKIIEQILDRKQDDEIRYLQKILVKDFELKDKTQTEFTDKFKLPENYFDFSSAYSKASTSNCKGEKIDLFEIKDDDTNAILSDEFNSPSFEHREAPFTFSEDRIVLFKKDFTHNSVLLSYYRYPKQLKLINEDDPESDFTPDSEIEFDDKLTDRIITMAASEFKLQNNDPTYQVNKQQTLNKI